MKLKIVRLEIVDNDEQFDNSLLTTYLLVNPDWVKLVELKYVIEHRFDTDGLTDEEIAAKEEFCDNIWRDIELFIRDNFVVLPVDETYVIEY